MPSAMTAAYYSGNLPERSGAATGRAPTSTGNEHG